MKLPVISGKNAIKVLCKAGFRTIRQRGSHVRLEKVIEEDMVKITIPLHKELKKGTLSKILKDANVSVEEFERLR